MPRVFAAAFALPLCFSHASAQGPGTTNAVCGDSVAEPGEACDAGEPSNPLDSRCRDMESS